MSRSGVTNQATVGAGFSGEDLSYALSITNAQHATVQLSNGGTTYRVYNSGTIPVFLSFRQQTATMPALTIPSDGTPGNTTFVAPGEVKTFTGPPNALVSGIAAAAGPAVVYIQPGEGV